MAGDDGGNTGGLHTLTLRDRHEAAGARFAPFSGWEMPLRYEGTVSEHEAVRTSAGVFDVSHLGRVWLEGPQAAALLRSVTTFDVTTLEPGSAHYSLYCNSDGGIDDDVFIYHLPGGRWLIVHNAANAAADFERLRAVVPQAADVTTETVMLAVQGPEAMGVLCQVLNPALGLLAQRRCVELEWRGTTVLFARTGYTGEDGGEAIVTAEHAGELWDELLGAGATPTGLGARDTLRTEAALPLWGNDIDAGTDPYEAGLGFAISLDDGAPFTGREALVAAKARPRARRLGHLSATERGVPRAGQEVRMPGAEVVAELTSGTFSPTLRHGIGMAYLPVELARPGVRLEIDVRGRALPMETVRRPFYRKVSKS